MNKWTLLVVQAVLPSFITVQTTYASTFLFADALIWQIRESNASNWAQELTPSATHETIRFFEVPFKYSPGIRVGAGFQTEGTPWQTEIYYTGYKTHGRNEAHTDTAELHPAFSGNFYANNAAGNGISGPYYHHAAIQWDVAFSTFDLIFSRSITVDKGMQLRPFLGLRAARIYQTIHSQWQDPYKPTTQTNPNPTPITTFSYATETISNHFKGIGPSFGLDSSWNLFKTKQNTLALIGNASGALLWSSWAFSDQYVNNTPQTIATESEPLSSSAFMVQAFLGIEFASTTNNTEWSIRLGYEEQAWFNQLQYYSFDMGKTNDTLYLQGAVLGLNINF